MYQSLLKPSSLLLQQLERRPDARPHRDDAFQGPDRVVQGARPCGLRLSVAEREALDDAGQRLVELLVEPGPGVETLRRDADEDVTGRRQRDLVRI